MVRAHGIGPWTSVLSGQRSTTELCTRVVSKAHMQESGPLVLYRGHVTLNYARSIAYYN